MYFKNGVIITPNVIVKGDETSVSYKGVLSNSGADSIFMRVGYGDNFENSKDIQMKKTDDGFKAALPVVDDKPLKLAFKDSADNWDNNGGRNYTFEVQTRL
jgi:hypothetical protein